MKLNFHLGLVAAAALAHIFGSNATEPQAVTITTNHPDQQPLADALQGIADSTQKIADTLGAGAAKFVEEYAARFIPMGASTGLKNQALSALAQAAAGAILPEGEALAATVAKDVAPAAAAGEVGKVVESGVGGEALGIAEQALEHVEPPAGEPHPGW